MKKTDHRPYPETIFSIAREELRNVFRDGGVVIFFFLVPLFYPLLYAFIYNNEVVRDVKLAVVDRSDTYLSREFIRRVDATPHTKVIGVYADMEEAKHTMDRKEAYGILLFPSEFSKEVHTGKQTTISLYCDMSSILHYKALLSSATDVSLRMSRDFSIPYHEVTIFNTQGGFASFLVPAILMLVIQQTLLLGVCMLGGTSRERRRNASPLPAFVSESYGETLRKVLGRSFVYLLFYTVISLWVLVVVPRLFSLPQMGNPGELLLFLLPYLLACIFFSMTLSGFITSRESPFLLFVFTSIIFLFLSGISWPVEAIPPFWRALGYLFPSTPGIQGYIRIGSMGASLHAVAFEYRLLWIQAGVYFAAAGLIFRYRR
ncbi:MAG: ABC transporter permease [Tannerellaceae bacterium]|jgi:ABC-2 type transport system permease protein|nr:ABC transporter permease [Tannerellaceae bacterium]